MYLCCCHHKIRYAHTGIDEPINVYNAMRKKKYNKEVKMPRHAALLIWDDKNEEATNTTNFTREHITKNNKFLVVRVKKLKQVFLCRTKCRI